jgi:hypothetical protein
MRVLPILMLVVAGCSSATTLPSVVDVAGGASAAAHRGLVVKVATATKPPIHLQKGTMDAFAVEGKEESASVRNVTVRPDVGSLPIDATLCQTNPSTGQCLSAPSPSLKVNVNHNQVVVFSVFLTATGSIAKGTVRVDFTEKGALVGSGKVAVTTK